MATSVSPPFAALRRRLLEHAELTGKALDEWIDEHETEELTLSRLSELVRLIELRRELLQQLIKLDDDQLDSLLTLRPSR